MSFLVAILGLAFLIFVHELGHFLVAKAVGMRPRKFYIGFGPPLARTTRGGVEYGIGSIPLGGYVKIPGMHRPAPGDLKAALSPGQQVELAEPLGVLDESIERGDDPGARAALAALEPELGATRAWQELDGGLSEDAYWRQRTWKRVVAILAGPAMNIAFAVVLFAVLFMVGTTRATRTVERVLANHPAARAGIRPGDTILAIDGRRVTAKQISVTIDGSRGRPLTLLVQRGGSRVRIGPLRARKVSGSYRIGIGIRGVPGPGESPPRATWDSLRLTWFVTRDTGRSVVRLASGQGSRQISSSVGIVRVSSQAFRVSFQDFLFVLGLISLAIALLNLLPILPLDGGHILMSMLERVRGRAFPQVVYVRFAAVGFGVFALLMYLGLRNDLFGGAG